MLHCSPYLCRDERLSSGRFCHIGARDSSYCCSDGERAFDGNRHTAVSVIVGTVRCEAELGNASASR